MSVNVNDLPDGWVRQALGDILVAKYGKALPEKNRRGGQVGVYGSNGPVGAHDEAITQAPVIVIGRKGSVGAINYSDQPIWPIDTTYFVDDFGGLDPRFVRRLLQSLRLDQFDRSTAIPGLSRQQLYEQEVALPPLDEQRRIAAWLDEIESRRASIAARLAAARAIVDGLRTAVLAAACSGRLTLDWRDEQGTPPSEAPDGPPATWTPTRLGDFVRIATGATPLRKNAAYYEAGTIPWVTSGAVNAGIVSEPTELITPRALAETNVKLFPPGTLLIAMYGEGQTRGRVAELAIEAGTNQALAAIVFDDASAQFKPYLRLFFENGYQRMRAASLGGVQPNLSLGMFKETVLPLPPLDEQRVIVERAAASLAIADRLRAAIASVESLLGDASRATVRRAFRGDLVPTEDEPIIAGDEPAHEEADRSAVATP